MASAIISHVIFFFFFFVIELCVVHCCQWFCSYITKNSSYSIKCHCCLNPMKAVLQKVWAILNLTLSNVYFTFLKEQNMNHIFCEKWINNLSVLNVEYCKCWTLLKITPLIYWACSLKANKRNTNKNRHLFPLTIIYLSFIFKIPVAEHHP